MKIAITGSTGQLGRIVVDKIKGKVAAAEVVALARNPAKASGLDVPVRAANYDDPASLVAAFAGVDTVLLISANELGRRVPQHRNVIESAKKAAVKRIVYTSLLHADTSSLSLAEEHKATEAAIKASGLSFTLLRNGWYTENYTGSIGGALASGAFIGSAGAGRISSATRADFAEAAVVVLTGAEHAGKTYELAGDASYTLSDLAAEISRQAGKTIPYKNLPESEYAAALAGFGLPEGFAKALASWDLAASHGALFDEGRQLSKLIGRPTTPLSAAVAAALAQKP